MKRILVVHFSQTGQLTRAVSSVVAPLVQAGHVVTQEVLQPAQPYPFPWPALAFLDAFPESVLQRPAPIRPIQTPSDAPFDLVILAYQAWYLSPSQPMTAFLQSPEARRLLQGRPVVTMVVCRNMWLMAQEQMKALIAAAGGIHRDHIALTDPPEHAIASFITTPRWLLTGRRNAFWGLPAAGVPERDLADASRFGQGLAEALARDEEQGAAPMLRGLRAAPVQTDLIMSERAGYRAFRVWAPLLAACGAPGRPLRRLMLLVFMVYLVLMILTVVPISRLLQRLLAPVLRPRLLRMKAQFEAPSGAACDRLKAPV